MNELKTPDTSEFKYGKEKPHNIAEEEKSIAASQETEFSIAVNIIETLKKENNSRFFNDLESKVRHVANTTPQVVESLRREATRINNERSSSTSTEDISYYHQELSRATKELFNTTNQRELLEKGAEIMYGYKKFFDVFKARTELDTEPRKEIVSRARKTTEEIRRKAARALQQEGDLNTIWEENPTIVMSTRLGQLSTDLESQDKIITRKETESIAQMKAVLKENAQKIKDYMERKVS